MNKDDAITALKTVTDPELGIDVWTLGLIYDITIKKDSVHVDMTFTTPLCPYGPQLLELVRMALEQKGFSDPHVNVTFNPPWKPSEEIKEMLGM